MAKMLYVQFYNIKDVDNLAEYGPFKSIVYDGTNVVGVSEDDTETTIADWDEDRQSYYLYNRDYPPFRARYSEVIEKGEIEGLRAEVARLKLYTNQKLFAAASGVLEAWDDYNQVSIPFLIEALEEQYIPRLIEAVAWWDNLPFDPDKDTERLPKYEMEAES